MYSVDATFKDMTSLLSFIKTLIGPEVIKGDTDRQNGDIINITFLKESVPIY
jgi:hypothetical protein